jgi:hypothetical protein
MDIPFAERRMITLNQRTLLIVLGTAAVSIVTTAIVQHQRDAGRDRELLELRRLSDPSARGRQDRRRWLRSRYGGEGSRPRRLELARRDWIRASARG